MHWETLLKEIAPKVLATLARRYRDFSAAEDAVQEALLAASRQWPSDGVPEHPRAWLTQVASNRLRDAIRSDAARRRRETEAAFDRGYQLPAPDAPGTEDDDSLTLLLLCCHPALTVPSAIALTLRAAGGLNTAEIARAFLVPESTMAQRISRAKETIRASGIPFRMPAPDDELRILRSVLHVLYLIFNEGYTASAGDSLQRADLAAEAIRLARLVHSRRPADPETNGLLALMLLTDARRDARTGSHGEPIPLDQQDRTLWNQHQIREGVALVSGALRQGAVGPYQLQAAIAALHDEAPTPADTDWRQILALYDVLLRIAPNPVVLLNRSIAVAMVHGPHAGLRELDALQADSHVGNHHRLHAARGHLQEMAGDPIAAAASYREAAMRTANLPERVYLLQRASRLLREPTPPP